MSRWNFIPGLTQGQSYAAAAGVIVLVGAMVYFGSRPRYQFKTVYDWNDGDITAIQGAPFTVRVPRGQEFLVASPDLLLQAQFDFANETHLVLLPLVSNQPKYELRTVIVDGVSGKTYPIKITAVPAQDLPLPPKTQELPA